MAAVARQDAWLACLPAMTAVATGLWLLARVMARFPDRDLYQAMVDRFPVGGVAGRRLYHFYFLILARDLRMLTDFVNITLLQRTPVIVIASLIGLCIIGAARGGVEMLARMTEFFAPTLCFAAVLIRTLVLEDLTIYYFQPFLEAGLIRPLLGRDFTGC